ncbi:MAG: hypothetical protein HKM06_08995 [Spirochaetales bacterium]|nr:hypothetical protein [Spirochaetales bacterium]
MIFALFSAAFVVITIFYLTIAIRILFLGKPTILRSSWVVTFLGLLIIPFTYQVLTYVKGDSPFSWIGLTGPVLYLALLVFYFFVMKGYTFYGVAENDFQTALREALKGAGLNFEEKIGRIEFTGSDMVLRYSYNAFSGSGILRFQKAQTPENVMTSQKVVLGFREFFVLKKIKTRKGVGVLYLLFSLVLLFLTGQLLNMLLRHL